MPEPDEELIELATKVFGLARNGAAERLGAYVDAGVDVDLTNQNGDSLLMLAAYHAHPETVQALLARGADPNRLNDRGQTPLAGAARPSRRSSGGWSPPAPIRTPGSRPRRRRRRCSSARTWPRCYRRDRRLAAPGGDSGADRRV